MATQTQFEVTTEEIKDKLDNILYELTEVCYNSTPENTKNQNMKIQQALWLIEEIVEEI